MVEHYRRTWWSTQKSSPFSPDLKLFLRAICARYHYDRITSPTIGLPPKGKLLDADTKRRIDTARDILVGKVPDPKSQVEQITIALIYKFMDDMDALSEELGGERSFFAGEFGRYGWAN